MSGLVERSARQVPMVSPDAMVAAARFLSREWGDYGYRLGYAGIGPNPGREEWGVYVWQCRASDGSRFLIWSDQWGNAGQYAAATERDVAAELDVETHVGQWV